jgi:hypothetical protein
VIDEDINERMARLVPQPGGVGEMPSQIPLGISMTPTFERPNAAPDIDTDYADAARRIADSRRTQMMSSLVNITAVDPDSAARSQKLGSQFGVGGDLAARNAEELRQRAFIDSISGRDMLRRNPVLADYIAQRQFAEIAHDDVDALAKTEQEFSKGWFTRFVSEGIAGIGEGFGRAVAQEEMASIYERQRQRGGRLEVYEKAALDSYREEMAKGGERTGFLEEAAYIGSQQLTGAPRIIEAGMMGATAGGGLGLVGGPAGFATVPAGMVTGATAGLAAGAFENSRRLETAMLYGELQPELGHESADRIATTVGIFNAALDTGAAALVAKPFAGLLRGAVRQKVSEAIRQQTTRAALANAAKAYGIGVAGEVTTETVQELNNVIGSEIGRYLADKPMEIETEEGREAIATRLVDTFVATAMGMSIMGAPGPAGRLYVDTRAAKQGEQQAAKLQSMVKAIADNKLLARSPERLEEFAESAVEGTDSETTYVNAAVMHDILRQSGITEQEMDTVLPGVRAQLMEMQQNGIDLGNNDVTVPTAQMTVRLQKTPLLNQILPHARLSPDAMSITEVQQFEANREQLVAEARQIMETRQETDATFVAEAQQVEDNAFEQVRPVLDAIKIDEDIDKDMAARTIAKLRQAMVVVDAAEAGMTPLQYEREYGSPLRVQGDVAPVAPLEQAITLEQAATLDSDYLAAVERGDMATAQRMVDEAARVQGQEAVTRDEQGNVVPLSRRFDITSPKVFEQAAQPGAARVLGPIEAAKKLVQETGRESFTDADEFFQKRWDALLKQTGRQLEPTSSNFAEAAKRAVSDILDFVKNNPKFADYYANDWRVTRAILDDYIGRPITDDEFALYRTIAGLTSPNTMLPSNISDTVGLWNHWMRFGNFDAFTLGPKPLTGALVVFEAAEPISGTTANIKVRTLKIIERLIKERGGVTQALQYLQEGVPVKELHKFNRKMGYAGNATDIGNITDLVMQATGQDKLIPRMFIFGQKVGAYTLNAIGDERYTTVDIWESRYIRSHFLGMFDKNIGLPESTEEHQIFTRFGDLFKQEMEAVTGRKWAPSALQALRWFYIIGSSREAGYSKASTNETISFYTERQLTQAFGYSPSRAAGGGSGAGAVAAGSGAGKVLGGRIEPKPFERNLTKDVDKLTDVKLKRRAIAAGYVRFARHNSELGAGGFSFVERRLASPGRHGTLTSATVAAEFTAGSRLRTAFEKAELPIPVMQELVADENGAEAFRSLVVQTNESNPHGAAVAAYTADEYQQKRLFVTADGTAGFALTTDGDIVSVFSAPGSGNGRAVMALAVQVGGTRLDCFDTVLPSYYAAHGFRAVARLPWNDEYAPVGWDAKAFAAYNKGKPDVVFMVYEPGYTGEYKAGAGASVSEYGDGVAAQTSELNAIAKKRVFEQAAAGPARGGFDPRTLNIFIRSGGDISTMFHELIHLRIAEYLRLAAGTNPPARVVADLDILFKFMGVEGDTFEDRLRNYSTMSIEKRAPLEEKVTYNAEIYIWEGKAPSVELRGVFDRMAAWMRRAYKSIRDNLNDIYRDKFGTDLPILTPEVRGVFDRMLATEEQIKRQAALNEMKPQFQTLEQALASGMTEAEYAAYQVMQQEAMDAAVTDMTKASLRQMQWLGNARSRLLRDLQRKHDRQRKEVRDEVAEEIRLQPVYRAMEYLRTGTFVDSDGQSVKMEGPHRLDMEAVRNIYAGMPTPESLEAIRATGMAVPTNVAPDIAALGTGGKGMMGKDGIDPDVAAELFGYSSGDALIRALLAATPMKDAIDARTDEVMLARFSDLVDPKARDAAVQTALHNEARARFVAVELRFVAKATQPTRVLIEAARQAAREMIAGKRIVDVKPQEFIAAESRAARDAADLGKYEAQAKITGKAEYDRVRLAALAAGSTEEDAVRVAEEAQAAFVAARTAEREAEFKTRFGASTVQQALIRAKRAQLYQNQLAAEALRVREEVDKGVKYLKQVLRDSNVKRMGADYADQIERVLERFNLARLSAKARAERQSLVEWLAKLEQDGLVPDLAPEVIDEANRKPYQEMTVAEFRDLVEAVKQLEYIGKNAQKIKRAEEMAEFNEVRDEIVDSIKSNYTGKVTKPRTPTTAAGRRIAGMKRFLYRHLKAAAIARIFDGGKDDGPVWRYLIRTANAAGDMETRMRAEATKRLTEILAPVFKLGKMGGKGIYFPTIGQSLNREARLVIALNMGNDGNRQRLLDGEGWTLEQLTPVLESLTEAEWNAVQQVWDFLETYRPLIAAKERRLYGKEPNWVTPTPFTVRTADGKEVRLSGGYYPIKYDPVATERAETAEEAEAAKAQLRSAYTAATTRRSFTKARARQVRGRPLLYTMSGVYGGVNDVIHDLSWHEWLIQANRLMRDEKFSSTVRETYGVEAVRQLKDWIKDNAAGEQASQGAADQAVSILRRNVSAAGLGFNVVSAALQLTGFSQSIVRVGAKHIARGVALTVGSPIATFKAVNEKSSFMAERSRTQFRELNELRNMVQDESASARRLRLGTYFLMMRMQRMVDVPTWVGAYEKALEAGKDEDTAVALADQAVIDSQGGGMLKDLSAAERGGPVSKLFTVFYSYMNTVYNMGAVSTMTPRSKGRLASDYLMLLVVPVVLNYALKNALTPDIDDEEPDLEKIAQDLIAEELAFLMGTMVVVREFQLLADKVTGREAGGRGYEGPAGLRGIGETMKFATQASQGEFDRAFRKSAVNMLGLATGLPSAQINRTLDGIEALAEGETENPFAPLTGVKR